MVKKIKGGLYMMEIYIHLAAIIESNIGAMAGYLGVRI
jgi:hypothetical protein